MRAIKRPPLLRRRPRSGVHAIDEFQLYGKSESCVSENGVHQYGRVRLRPMCIYLAVAGCHSIKYLLTILALLALPAMSHRPHIERRTRATPAY